MKRIIKETAPEWFEDWKEDFASAKERKAHYKNDFSSDDKDGYDRRIRLRKALISEQGRICCYCMTRISERSSHIEHFFPKEQFPEMDLDYHNLLASCNGEGSIILDEEHCGHRKGNWWRNDMISPTHEEIEKMFRYFPDGRIRSVRGHKLSNIAQEMILNFGLDSFHLVRNRRQAIEGSEVFDEEDYTDDDIRSFIDYYSNMDGGAYVPYCQAIVDCLCDMLE